MFVSCYADAGLPSRQYGALKGRADYPAPPMTFDASPHIFIQVYAATPGRHRREVLEPWITCMLPISEVSMDTVSSYKTPGNEKTA